MSLSSLDIKIIGGGVAGLAAALSLVAQPSQHGVSYTITVLESTSSLSEFGAGIQLGPNATRILGASLGLDKEFTAVANEPERMKILRYDDNRVLGERFLDPSNEWSYGYPHWQFYRPDIQRILAEAVTKAGIRVLFNQRVSAVDHETGTITFADGRTESADLVIAADGLRGKIREMIPGNEGIKAVAFPEFCFRAVIPKERLLAWPDLREIHESGQSTVWVGPGCCVLAYPIHGGKLHNVLISTPQEVDEREVGKWSEPGDVADGAELLKGFSEQCQRLWSLVTETTKWTLGYLPELKSYASASGRLCVIGDAAHAILPHSGQGGCSALEDAASLAACIARMSSAADLPQTLAQWDQLRQHRMSLLRIYANGNQNFLSLPDGPDQERRDAGLAAMTKAWKDELAALGPEGVKNKPKPPIVLPEKGGINNMSAGVQRYVADYDAIAEARKAMVAV